MRVMSSDEQARQVRKLRVDSDALLDGLEKMKHAEQRKRRQQISTPEFHELADEVEKESARVFRLAQGEAALDDRTDETGTTIEETPEEGHRLA
jgi:hypothetical protein